MSPTQLLQDKSVSHESHDIRLTKYAKRAGCAAKQPPDYLLALLPTLPRTFDENILIGSSTMDDAAIYKLNDDLALVLTTDFFTPIVDLPYDFGAIAAANALSDVYAMGGKPLSALSIVGFPDSVLPPEVLRDILRGAADKCAEAGIAIVGGHSIKSEEPIFGLAVVGTIHPHRILANSNAKPEDLLVLTKPLGLGVITTAAKNGKDKHGAIEDAIEVMKTLNNRACDVLTRGNGTNAMTDITGFGLLGHLRNIVDASGVGAVVYLDEVPILGAPHDYVRDYVRAGIVPGGTKANHKFLTDWVQYAANINEVDQMILCDAQTSGGLLASVKAETAQAIVQELHAHGMAEAKIIGRITAELPRKISVIPSRMHG
ncbi:MAG: selenide, water dikinase SelD [Pirellula sp.]